MEERVKLAQRGEDNEFYELIQERKTQLYTTAYTYVKNKEDALDIVQDTVYKAYISIKKLKEPKYFNTWLTRILINCCLDFMRKHKKVLLLDEKMATEKIGPALDNKEEALDLYNAIHKLKEQYKTIVILKYFQNLTLSEIAEMLGNPIGTVKSNLHKALKELRIELVEEGM